LSAGSLDDPAFLDANIVLRYLTQDSTVLAGRARQIIEDHPSLRITEGILAEIAYVLVRVYQVPRAEVVDALIALLRRSNIQVHQIDTELAIQALSLCRPSGRVSFADAMLWAVARSTGARTTLFTFDARFPDAELDVRGEYTAPDDR
jgi:predicted nucleic-acid-binding protein